MFDYVSEREAVLVATGDQFVTDLLEHLLLFGRANLDRAVSDEGPGALLGVEDAEDFEFRVGFADGVRVDLQGGTRL